MSEALKLALVFGAAADGLAAIDLGHFDMMAAGAAGSDMQTILGAATREEYAQKQMQQRLKSYPIPASQYFAYRGIAELFTKIAQAEADPHPDLADVDPEEIVSYLVEGPSGFRWSTHNEGAARRQAALVHGTITPCVRSSRPMPAPNA